MSDSPLILEYNPSDILTLLLSNQKTEGGTKHRKKFLFSLPAKNGAVHYHLASQVASLSVITNAVCRIHFSQALTMLMDQGISYTIFQSARTYPNNLRSDRLVHCPFKTCACLLTMIWSVAWLLVLLLVLIAFSWSQDILEWHHSFSTKDLSSISSCPLKLVLLWIPMYHDINTQQARKLSKKGCPFGMY